MQKYINALAQNPLFSGISSTENTSLLQCLGATAKSYAKGSFIYMAGDSLRGIGLVLKGKVLVLQDDFWGNRDIVAQIGAGGIFAEAFCCAGLDKIPVSVLAADQTDIMFIDYERIISRCPAACAFHSQLVKNMLGILARKNVTLTKKIKHVGARRTREKLLSYLSGIAAETGSTSVQIPFNRQDLADYLAVERSAMSAELSKMRAEGLVEYHKNHFRLIRNHKSDNK